jgi:hypothetical protein
MSVTQRTSVLVSLLCLSGYAIPSSYAFSPESNGWKLVTGEEKKKLLETVWDCEMDGQRALQPITIKLRGDSGEFDAWQPNGSLGYTAKLLNIKAYRTPGGSFVILGEMQQPTLEGQFRWQVDQSITRIEGTMWFTEPQSNFLRKVPGAHGRVIGKAKPK